MADAIPVHGTGKPAVEKKQPKQKPQADAPKAEEKSDDQPKRGVPYTLPSGTVCVDH